MNPLRRPSSGGGPHRRSCRTDGSGDELSNEGRSSVGDEDSGEGGGGRHGAAMGGGGGHGATSLGDVRAHNAAVGVGRGHPARVDGGGSLRATDLGGGGHGALVGGEYGLRAADSAGGGGLGAAESGDGGPGAAEPGGSGLGAAESGDDGLEAAESGGRLHRADSGGGGGLRRADSGGGGGLGVDRGGSGGHNERLGGFGGRGMVDFVAAVGGGGGIPGAWPGSAPPGAWPGGAPPAGWPSGWLGGAPPPGWLGGTSPGSWPCGTPPGSWSTADGSSSSAAPFLDWSAVAGVALDPNFSFSNPNCGVFSSVAADEDDEVPLPMGGRSKQGGGRGGRRGGGRGGRRGVGRGCGRGGRPPIPSSPRTIPAAVDIENTLEDTPARLKGDYGIWKQLLKQTGLGWDASDKNIVMTDEWWKKINNGVIKFKDKGLEHEDYLDVMFQDLHNSGDDHWCASSGVAPSQGSPCCENLGNDCDEGEEDDDSEPEELTPTSTRGKRIATTTTSKKGKQPKTTGGQWFQEQMRILMDINKRTIKSCESFANKEDKTGSSIQNIMQMVKDCGATPGSSEHFIASIIFTKRAEREMFMTIDTPEERLQWLKMKYEWMTRNDVAK